MQSIAGLYTNTDRDLVASAVLISTLSKRVTCPMSDAHIERLKLNNNSPPAQHVLSDLLPPPPEVPSDNSTTSMSSELPLQYSVEETEDVDNSQTTNQTAALSSDADSVNHQLSTEQD